MKRIVLFLATNLAVLVVLSVVLRLFGLDRAIYGATGLDYGSLLVFSLVVGFTGAIISLLMSKSMAVAKWKPEPRFTALIPSMKPNCSAPPSPSRNSPTTLLPGPWSGMPDTRPIP